MSETIVRHSKRDDADSIAAIYAGKQAVAGTLQLPYVADSLWQDRLEKPSPGVHSLVALLEGRVLGHIVLSVNQNLRRNHSGVIGMAVHDDYVRRGIGSALLAGALDMADNWLNLSRVELTVFTDNNGAKDMYEKAGFVVEGEARQFAFRDGKFIDAFYMARVR